MAQAKELFINGVRQVSVHGSTTVPTVVRYHGGNRPITVVLLSGGSSNIRWLKPLLERDVASALSEAEVLELSENFQEIVAKGLAVECARRFRAWARGGAAGLGCHGNGNSAPCLP
jgi:hypothetical protein